MILWEVMFAYQTHNKYQLHKVGFPDQNSIPQRNRNTTRRPNIRQIQDIMIVLNCPYCIYFITVYYIYNEFDQGDVDRSGIHWCTVQCQTDIHVHVYEKLPFFGQQISETITASDTQQVLTSQSRFSRSELNSSAKSKHNKTAICLCTKRGLWTQIP
jgi:hypothetical protein